jgi:hypothetical protein
MSAIERCPEFIRRNADNGDPRIGRGVRRFRASWPLFGH